MKRWIIRIALTLVSLTALFLAFVIFAGTKTGPLPAAAPGYQVLPITAAHRPEGLALHLWYPASEGAVSLVGQNALFYGFHARQDAAGDGQTHPLVLLSHGSGGNAERLGWVAADLAARGFIVAAVNHPGTTSRDSLPARTVMPWERTADLTAVLDYLAATPPAGIRPDMARVGALGFSLGGASVLAVSGARLSKAAFIDYCAANKGQDDCGWLEAGGVDFTTIDAARYEQDNRDPRIKAVVAVDPALSAAMTPDSVLRLPPALIVNLGSPGEIPAAMRADKLAAMVPDASYQTVAGAWHFSFLARCSLFGKVMIGAAGDDNICADKGDRDRLDLHAEIAKTIGAFFEAKL